jgi:hypothetical protein
MRYDFLRLPERPSGLEESHLKYDFRSDCFRHIPSGWVGSGSPAGGWRMPSGCHRGGRLKRNLLAASVPSHGIWPVQPGHMMGGLMGRTDDGCIVGTSKGLVLIPALK